MRRAANALGSMQLAHVGLSYRMINRIMLLEAARDLFGRGADLVTHCPPWGGKPSEDVQAIRGGRRQNTRALG